MKTFDFNEKLEFSLGAHEDFDIGILQRIFKFADIKKTDEETDRKTGVDYIATLRKGGTVNIDAKTREPGASKFWKFNPNQEPELALEIWSAKPVDGNKGKAGWTLDESSNVDYILYTFDKSDTNKFYFIPLQLLRISYLEHYNEWNAKYKHGKQYTTKSGSGWHSECIFVPASVILSEINKHMQGELTVCMSKPA